MKKCEFKADVFIDGRLTRRMVIGDAKTLATRTAILKSTGKRVDITISDYNAFKEWYKSSPPNTYGKAFRF